MKFELSFGALRMLRAYTAEYIAACAFRRWIEEEHPEIKQSQEMGDWSLWHPYVKIWTPPPSTVSRLASSKRIHEELLMPELRPLERIIRKGGSYPDLVATVELGEGKEEKYFIEVKSGEARLDDRQKRAQTLAKLEGYIPLVISVKKMDVEGNFFDIVIKKPKVK
ncbi:hypothetical protein ES703_26120 [subsurface metagenome]|nr:MAG: hypothetical protein CEE41_01330 [Hadesarchaea archaeon B3_Hades]